MLVSSITDVWGDKAALITGVMSIGSFLAVCLVHVILVVVVSTESKSGSVVLVG